MERHLNTVIVYNEFLIYKRKFIFSFKIPNDFSFSQYPRSKASCPMKNYLIEASSYHCLSSFRRCLRKEHIKTSSLPLTSSNLYRNSILQKLYFKKFISAVLQQTSTLPQQVANPNDSYSLTQRFHFKDKMTRSVLLFS